MSKQYPKYDKYEKFDKKKKPSLYERIGIFFQNTKRILKIANKPGRKDYFLVFAHVEADNGLWGGLSGGRIQELAKDEQFKNRTLGFQKVLTHNVSDRVCRVKVQEWLGNCYPAEIEGSDCKSIDEVGQGKKTYIKIGDYLFPAVKYALVDFKNRIAPEPVRYIHSFVKSISFEGGVLDGKEIDF